MHVIYFSRELFYEDKYSLPKLDNSFTNDYRYYNPTGEYLVNLIKAVICHSLYILDD